MRVLVLSFHVPPDPAVGSLRVGRVIEAFRSAGHEVEVIAPRLPESHAEKPLEGVTVHRVARWRNGREWALALRGSFRRRRASNAGITDEPHGYQVPEHIPAWKRFLVAMALMPDDQQGFIIPAVARALRLRRARRFDVLYTSGPPHSAQVAGLVIARLTGVRWVAEFRDPWTDNAIQPRYARSEAARGLKRWLERRTLARADRIVTVSESAGRVFAAKHATIAQRLIVARNGIDDAPIAVERPTEVGPVRVVYVGNLYHARDPRPFLAAVSALIEDSAITLDDVRIDFYGECGWYQGVDVRGLADGLGLGSVFTLHGPVPRSDALRRSAEADVLLLLAQNQPLQVPTKLYEYLGARRPILAFADGDGETALMLEQAGGHFIVATDHAEATRTKVLAALRARAWEPLDGIDRLIEEWSVRRQMGHLVSEVEAAASAGVQRRVAAPVPGNGYVYR